MPVRALKISILILISIVTSIEIPAQDNDYFKNINDVDSLNQEAIRLANNKAYESALNGFYKAEILFRKSGKLKKRFKTIINIARCFDDMGYFEESQQYWNKAGELLDMIHEREPKFYYFNNFGDFYWRNGKFAQAIENYLLSEQFIENIDQKKSFLLGMATSYADMLKTEKSLSYFYQVLDIPDINEKYIFETYRNIAVVHINSNNFDSSYNYLKTAEAMGFVDFELFNNLANTMNKLGKQDSAFIYINKADSIAQKLNAHELIAYNELVRASIYFEIKDYTKALESLKKSEDYYIEIPNYKQLIQINDFREKLFAHIDKPDSSLKYKKITDRYRSLQDSSENSFIESKKNSIALINKRLEDIDEEVDEAEAGFGSGYLLLLSAFGLGLIVLGLFAWYRRRKNTQRHK